MFIELYGKTIAMEGSILGFQQLNSFVLVPIDESDNSSPFAYMQSMEEEQVGFLIAHPFTFVPEYELQLPEDEKELLEVSEPQDVAVFGLVTIASSFEQSTVNLLAPLIINVRSLRGRQIVLPPDSTFTTRTPLFNSSFTKEES
jgi:flagellar assembly factor FliW